MSDRVLAIRPISREGAALSVRKHKTVATGFSVARDTFSTPDGRFYCACAVTGWPGSLPENFGLLRGLRRHGAGSTLFITRRSPERVKKDVARTKIRLEADLIEKGERSSMVADLEKGLDEIEELEDGVLEGRERIHDLGFYIFTAGETPRAARRKMSKVRKFLAGLFVESEAVQYRTERALRNLLPTGVDWLRTTRVMPTSAVAVHNPLKCVTTAELSGQPIWYGVNLTDRTPWIMDRFQLAASGIEGPQVMLLFTRPGGGKTTLVKVTEVYRRGILYRRHRIRVFDSLTDREYLRSAVELRAPYLEIRTIAPPPTVEETIREIARGRLADADAGARRVFEMENLQPAVAGRSANPTCIIYGISSMPPEQQQEAVGTYLRLLLAQRPGDPTVIVPEEPERTVLPNPRTLAALQQVVFAGRHQRLAITLPLKGAEPLLSTVHGRQIWDNSGIKIYLRHERVPKEVARSLPEEEVQFLLRAPRGHGVAHLTGRLPFRFHVPLSDVERSLVAT
ncbi:MAG: hypothetical protein QXQ87_04650 [Halobacteria archaeon]